MRTTFSLAPFATPLLLAVLHACGGDPGAPGAPEDPSASSDAPPAEAPASDTPRAPSDVEKGPSSGAPTIADDGATHIPWRGGNLIALREESEPGVPRFSIEGSDEAPPDFSSIADWKEQPNYPYSSPQYATLPSGELLVFDAAIDEGAGARMAGANPSVRATGATFGWGIDDPNDIKAFAPRLELVTETRTPDLPGYAKLPWNMRVIVRAMEPIRFLRRLNRLLLYRF